jgi:antitoxin FitA
VRTTLRRQAAGLAAYQLQRSYYDCMSVVITVRDIPDAVRDELAARAGRAGKSLQEYLRGMFVDVAARPTVDDVIARARARVTATGARADAKSILAARDADRR